VNPLFHVEHPEGSLDWTFEVSVGLLGGLLNQFKKGLKRTQELVLAPLGRLLGLRRLDEGQLEELEDLLLQADLGVKGVDQLMTRLRSELKGGVDVDAKAILKEELLKILRPRPARSFLAQGTQVVLLVGVNGVGKTTTLGKLAAHLKAQGDSVLVVAGDTFRAAAIDQLERWGERAGVPVLRNQMGGDPAAIAFDGAASAKAKGTSWVLIDTAGRLHTKDHLMKELDKIRRSLQKVIPEAPHRVLLVLDATTGQNGLAQAEVFARTAGVTDLVLTKLDGSAKGGVVVPILERLGLPIAFVGVGEGLEDLVPFDAEAFVDGLLDA
jgi:fused signal recognition particle receptor